MMAATVVICITAIIRGGVVRILANSLRSQFGSRLRWAAIHQSIERLRISVETCHSDASSQPEFVRRIPSGMAASESIADTTGEHSFRKRAGGEHPQKDSSTASRRRLQSRLLSITFMRSGHRKHRAGCPKHHVSPGNCDFPAAMLPDDNVTESTDVANSQQEITFALTSPPSQLIILHPLRSAVWALAQVVQR